MKKATCQDLKGACDFEITGATPEEMAENSKKHAMEMFAQQDSAHLEAMEAMKGMTPEDQQKWFEEFKEKFKDFPDA